MKKQIITVLSLLLALVTALGVLSGCAQPQQAVTTGSSEHDDTAAGSDTVEETTEPVETYYIPEIDYKGAEFTILCPGKNDNEWECKDFWAENETEDPVVSAIYRRQSLIEDEFGIKINMIEDATRTTIGELVKKDVTSNGKEYDIVMQVMSNAYTLAQSGYLINLENVPYLDLKSDVWDQSYLEQSSICGKNFFATGEITTMDNDATWVMMFNKKLANNLDIDVYGYINNNEWTFDKLYELTKDFYEDVNNNSKADEKDKFGIATTVDFIQGLFYAADGRIVKKDGTDTPYFDFNNEKNVAIVDQLIKIYTAVNKITFDCHDFQSVNPAVHLLAQEMFEEDRALFYSEVMQCAIRLREMETDYGIIPLPKFNSEQQNYTTHSVAAVTLCTMFITSFANDASRLERAGMVAQALAVEGKNILTPAYYEKSLISKGTRDAESYEMLPIIFANRTCDIGYMASESGISTLFNSLVSMAKKGTNEVASASAKNARKLTRALNKIIEDINKYD